MPGAFRRGGGGAFAQGEPSPREYLPQKREFSDEPTFRPPAVTTDETARVWQDYARPRIDVLKHLGVPPLEALELIWDMPDVRAKRREVEKGNAPPPDFDDLFRR